MTTIKLKLTEQNLAKSGPYMSHGTCLIATALRQRFPKTRNISVGGASLELGKKFYLIDREQQATIHRLYSDKSLLPFTVNLTSNK